MLWTSSAREAQLSLTRGSCFSILPAPALSEGRGTCLGPLGQTLGSSISGGGQVLGAAHTAAPWAEFLLRMENGNARQATAEDQGVGPPKMPVQSSYRPRSHVAGKVVHEDQGKHLAQK